MFDGSFGQTRGGGASHGRGETLIFGHSTWVSAIRTANFESPSSTVRKAEMYLMYREEVDGLKNVLFDPCCHALTTRVCVD